MRSSCVRTELGPSLILSAIPAVQPHHSSSHTTRLATPLVQFRVMAKDIVKEDHEFLIFKICIQPLFMAQASVDIKW